MMDQQRIYGSLFATVVVAALAYQALYTVHYGGWVPRLIELVACYWILASPALLGMVFAFAVGLLVSLLEGSVPGSASIALSFVAYTLLSNIYRIRQLDGVSQSVLIFLLLGVYMALHRVILALVGVPSEGLSYLLSVAVSAVIWRPLCRGLDRMRFALGSLF